MKADARDLKDTRSRQAWGLKGNLWEQLVTSGAIKFITRESQERLSISNNPSKLCKFYKSPLRVLECCLDFTTNFHRIRS